MVKINKILHFLSGKKHCGTSVDKLPGFFGSYQCFSSSKKTPIFWVSTQPLKQDSTHPLCIPWKDLHAKICATPVLLVGKNIIEKDTEQYSLGGGYTAVSSKAKGNGRKQCGQRAFTFMWELLLCPFASNLILPVQIPWTMWQNSILIWQGTTSCVAVWSTYKWWSCTSQPTCSSWRP